jgi:hypothetical protein
VGGQKDPLCFRSSFVFSFATNALRSEVDLVRALLRQSPNLGYGSPARMVCRNSAHDSGGVFFVHLRGTLAPTCRAGTVLIAVSCRIENQDLIVEAAEICDRHEPAAEMVSGS